jgi:excinuclease UvrABC helicase subunit UvrB
MIDSVRQAIEETNRRRAAEEAFDRHPPDGSHYRPLTLVAAFVESW